MYSLVRYHKLARENALKIHSTLQSAPESLIHCKCCKKPVTRETLVHFTSLPRQLSSAQELHTSHDTATVKGIKTLNTHKKKNHL